MTAEEKEKFTKMEQSVEEIKTDVSEIKSALIGNPLSGERGVVGQVGMLKAEIDYLKKDIKELQEEKARNSVYIKIIGAVSILLLATVLKLVFS